MGTKLNHIFSPSSGASQLADFDESVDRGDLGNVALNFAAATPSVVAKRGSVLDFLSLLRGAGIDFDSLVNQFHDYDLADIGNLLQYLRAAAFNGESTPQCLLFHIELMQSVVRSDYKRWKKLLQELRYRPNLSLEASKFVEEEDVGTFLYDLLLKKLGLDKTADLATRVNQVAFLRSLFSFLESWQSLITEDPNLIVLFRLINRYGSLLKYYAEEDVPRRSVRLLAELGYDTDYLVFGLGEILSTGPSEEDQPETWVTKLIQSIKETLGGKDREPIVDIGVDRFKVFHQIQDDFELLKEKEDKGAGLRIIEQLLARLEHRRAILLRNGDLVAHDQASSLVHRLQCLQELLGGDLEQLPAPQCLRAIRSPKLVPELLFDNTRLACCLFKPRGLFHGEISLLLLDPATPMIEFWLDPYQEFLGLATLYPGRNARGERAILMDTVDYDDRLLDLVGCNGTMRFMLNAMILDAHHAKADKLLVFAAPYGKPLGFANYVKQREGQNKSITYHDTYYFESTDPTDSALAKSILGKHHYTVAFGYGQPMIGVMDYGFNLVGNNAVTKLLTGGRGVYEIDVKAFLEQGQLTKEKRKIVSTLSAMTDISIYNPPPYQNEEIALRESQVLDLGLQKLSKIVDQPRLDVTRGLTPEIVKELMHLEEEVFEVYLRYNQGGFHARLNLKDAKLMLVRDDSELVGFVLSYASPILEPKDAIYLDTIAVASKYQSKGIGSILLEIFTKSSNVDGYSGIYVLTEMGSRSSQLVQFYERAGFQLLGAYSELSQLMYQPLSLTGRENAESIEKLLKESSSRLKQRITNARLSIYDSRDHQLQQILGSLEAVFPEEICYSETRFCELMTYPDAYLLVVHHQNEPIAFTISYNNPALPKHSIFLSMVSVKPEFQKRGIGTVLFKLNLIIPTLKHYTMGILECQKTNLNGVDLVDYFERFGATVIDEKNYQVRMAIPLRTPVTSTTSARPTGTGSPFPAAEGGQVQIASAALRRTHPAAPGE